VERVGPGNRVSLSVDGQAIEGNVAPLPSGAKKSVRVIARIGS